MSNFFYFMSGIFHIYRRRDMDLSFREKSTIVTLIITVILFGNYLVRACAAMTSAGQGIEQLTGLLVSTVLLSIVVSIISHIILASAFRKQASSDDDERDKLIELKSLRVSYIIIICGSIWAAVNGLFFSVSSAFVGHVIAGFFIFSEIAGDTAKLFFYRRGV